MSETSTLKIEDLRVGDRIRVTEVLDVGESTIREGVVSVVEVESGWFSTKSHYFETGEVISQKIELLERPQPAEPTGIGAVVFVNGNKFVRVGRGSRSWVSVGVDVGVGWTWTSFTGDGAEVTVLSEGI